LAAIRTSTVRLDDLLAFLTATDSTLASSAA
jgi:hypothetical protein